MEAALARLLVDSHLDVAIGVLCILEQAAKRVLLFFLFLCPRCHRGTSKTFCSNDLHFTRVRKHRAFWPVFILLRFQIASAERIGPH
jgi:hypothetical protein